MGFTTSRPFACLDCCFKIHREFLRDLYYLVKFLPAYALPPGIPSTTDLSQSNFEEEPLSIVLETPSIGPNFDEKPAQFKSSPSPSARAALRSTVNNKGFSRPTPISLEQRASSGTDVFLPSGRGKEHERIILQKQDESFLMPAYMPPKYGLFDLFPFSLLVRYLSERGKEVKGKKGARVRAQLKDRAISHNLPLEISLYLVRCT